MKNALSLLGTAIVLSALCACAGKKAEGRLDITLGFPAGWEDRLVMAYLSAPGVSPYVGTLRVEVEKDGSIIARKDAPYGDRRLDLGMLPAGSGYQIRVKAITREKVIMDGIQQGIWVPEGNTSFTTVQLQESNGFAYGGSLHYPRQWHSAVMFSNTNMLLIGGNPSTKKIEILEPSTDYNSSSIFDLELTHMSQEVKSHVFDNQRNLLVVYGNESEGNGEYEIIDCDSRQNIIGTVPGNRRGGYFSNINSFIYFMGGYEGPFSPWKTDSVKIDLDTQGRIIVSTLILFEGRIKPTMETILGYSYFIGGYANSLASPKIDIVNLNSEIYDSQINLPGPNVGCSTEALIEGSILIFGGSNGTYCLSTICTINTSNFTVQRIGSINIARQEFSSDLLGNGKILLIGGNGNGKDSMTTAELYDPITGQCEMVPWKMRVPRSGHTATLLPDGRVLVAGGNMLNTAFEFYRPPVAP